MSRKAQYAGDAVGGGEIGEALPCRVLDRHAVFATVLFFAELDLSGIEHFGEALREWGVFQVFGEIGDFLFERRQITERGDVEHSHEAPVVVAALRIDTETKSG